jgi:hypothetical protein
LVVRESDARHPVPVTGGALGLRFFSSGQEQCHARCGDKIGNDFSMRNDFLFEKKAELENGNGKWARLSASRPFLFRFFHF